MFAIPRGRAARAALACAATAAVAIAAIAVTRAADAAQSPDGVRGLNDSSVFGAGAKPLTKVPANDVARGLIYDGLRAAKTGPCVGGYEVVGVEPTICTHGPDAPPAGLDVKKGVKALSAPAQGVTAAAVGLPVCEGDGTTGKRVEVLYIHGSTNRYQQYLETFRTLAEGVDTIYNESARETGGERHVRFVTENVGGVCRPVVRDVQIADSALNSTDWAPLVNAVKAAGYTRTDRKYLEFVDARVFCGIGGFAGDTRKSDANRSNFGPEYARADNGCWNAGVAAHELGHNFGAVNNNAPNGSGFAHCVDEYDVMCYKDDPSVTIVVKCADRAHDNRLDCNHDDYYHTNPPAGSYLANNYNVADNLFLIKGTGGGTTTGPTTPPTTGPTTAPPGGNRAGSATASTSYVSSWESIAALNDGFAPTSSADRAHAVYGNWPQQGTQWVQYTWPTAQSLNRVAVYWFDDNQGIDLPASAQVQYWTGSAWANTSASSVGVAANTFNSVSFNTVSTTQLRLNVTSRSGFSTGILEWQAFAP
jgi:hypothetical protein